MHNKQVTAQQAIHDQISHITQLVCEYTNKDLEKCLPEIIEIIFGCNTSPNKGGWGLLSLDYTVNSVLYDIVYKFLHPHGTMFELCYKLLADPNKKYPYYLTYLPHKIQQSINEGTASPFYMEKLDMDYKQRTPFLALNAVELYMFHFVQHVVQQAQLPYIETKVYLPLYLRLAEEYLTVFLPCDGSSVLPEVKLSHCVPQSHYRSPPQKPLRTSTVFRQDVLMKLLKQSPAVDTLQTTANVGTWRSELLVQLCIDFWLNMPDPAQLFSERFSSSSQMLWSENRLPSPDHLHAVRLLVKHLHYFANSRVEDSSAMDQLKKMTIPLSQRRVYHFLREVMRHWPLDSSFKQILEIWLSYIQPWRYINFKTRHNRPRCEPQPVDVRWLPFLAENLLVYSVIFHELVGRFMMLDLASYRNAYMLYRLTRVFSQPNLSELLRQVEGSRGELDRQGYSKLVQSHFLDLEGPVFQYRPVFCTPLDPSIPKFICQVGEAESVAMMRMEEDRLREEQLTFWQRLFGSSGDSAYTLNERRNTLLFLSSSIKNLRHIFQIPEDSVDGGDASPRSPNYSQGTLRSVGRLKPDEILISEEGHPDLSPIRNNENTFLVRTLYYICAWVNINYCDQLSTYYSRQDMVGGIARQVLCGPRVFYYFDKRVPGRPVRTCVSLPPRLSLRLLANYHLLCYSALLVLMLKLITGLAVSSIVVLGLFLWLAVMMVRWSVGRAPALPVITAHDVSDSRLGQSFNS